MARPVTSSRPILPSLTRAFLFLLFLTPLLYWPRLYFNYSNAKLYYFLAISEIALILFLWTATRFQQWRPRMTLLSLLVFAYIGILLCASAFGVNPSQSFWGSINRTDNGIFWLHMGFVFFMLMSMFPTRPSWKNILFISSIVGLLVTAIFYLSFIFPDGIPLFSQSKGGSTLGNSSFFGTYLIFQIGFALYLFIIERKRLRLFAGLASVVSVITLFLTSAQAAKLAFLGGCVVFLPLFLLTDKSSRVKRSIGVASLLVLAVTFFSLWFVLLQPDSQLHKTVVAHSSETRFVLWDIAWQGIRDRPLLGWGLENYPDVFQIYYNPCLGSAACGGEIWFDSSHNKILDVLVHSGIVGLGFYVSLFIVSFGSLWNALKENRVERTTCALLGAVLLAYFVQNLTVFDTIVSDILFMTVLAFIAVIGNQPQRDEKKTDKGKAVFSWTATIATILLPFSFFWFAVVPLRGNIATTDVLSATFLSERIVAYEKAVSLSNQGIDLRRSMLAAQTATFILDLNEEQHASSPTLLQKELSLSENALQETIQRSPFFLRAYLDLAFVYQVWARSFGQEKMLQAESIAQDAVTRFPNNPLPYWSLVGLYLDEGKNEEALGLAKRALSLDPGVRTSQLRYLLTLKMVGELDELEKALEVFMHVDPSVKDTFNPYLQADTPQAKQEVGLLFRFYYDAGF